MAKCMSDCDRRCARVIDNVVRKPVHEQSVQCQLPLIHQLQDNMGKGRFAQRCRVEHGVFVDRKRASSVSKTAARALTKATVTNDRQPVRTLRPSVGRSASQNDMTCLDCLARALALIHCMSHPLRSLPSLDALQACKDAWKKCL